MYYKTTDMLTDRLGRFHNYLRISLTDKCNFRCTYCMPGSCYKFLPSKDLMSAEEIKQIARIFINMGVTKIRLTGGEPLVRKDFDDIVFRLSRLNAELLMTTNGSLVHKHLPALKSAGLSAINVSLDSLNARTFAAITSKNYFSRVWENILLLIDHNFRVKLNVVAIKGFIEKELIGFVDLTRSMPVHVRFIEFMPFEGNNWNKDKVITAGQMLELVRENFDIVKLKDEPNATAKKFKVIGHEGTFAFITTMSNQFCGECNRLRITAEGKIKNCLFGKEEIDLLGALRKGEDISGLIEQAVKNKFSAMGGQFMNGYEHTDASSIINRSMIGIGG